MGPTGLHGRWGLAASWSARTAIRRTPASPRGAQRGWPWQRVRYRDRTRVGGLWLCDNTIWSGYVATATDRECQAGVTAFIREHNRMVAENTGTLGSSVRTRNGVMKALRIE